ncbi:putative quinol monooxygenase [Streptomyces spiramenti]|uniref:Antibiotic biosynthesis monooxygenase n=1 Tax=Streptomyces spiramenti TaxID=2720606 RepID=A0ABX1AP08_9ACTN|nr:antibiotic biosynthesis monooxygenase [Streptomyces spiramenti]NJP68035.1 antibiotic biosynthesis monooxygenase [Streptomyces spiramenti]
MVIVAGHIVVDPGRRDAYLAECVPLVTEARRSPGCLDFALSPDIADSGRINVHERWTSRDAVESFRAGGPSPSQTEAMLSASVAEYEVTAGRDLT